MRTSTLMIMSLVLTLSYGQAIKTEDYNETKTKIRQEGTSFYYAESDCYDAGLTLEQRKEKALEDIYEQLQFSITQACKRNNLSPDDLTLDFSKLKNGVSKTIESNADGVKVFCYVKKENVTPVKTGNLYYVDITPTNENKPIHMQATLAPEEATTDYTVQSGEITNTTDGALEETNQVVESSLSSTERGTLEPTKEVRYSNSPILAGPTITTTVITTTEPLTDSQVTVTNTIESTTQEERTEIQISEQKTPTERERTTVQIPEQKTPSEGERTIAQIPEQKTVNIVTGIAYNGGEYENVKIDNEILQGILQYRTYKEVGQYIHKQSNNKPVSYSNGENLDNPSKAYFILFDNRGYLTDILDLGPKSVRTSLISGEQINYKKNRNKKFSIFIYD